MEFLRILEKIRFPGLDEVMLGITYLGDEIAFLIIALTIFWCIDKKLGYYVISVGCIGAVVNQFMKLLFRIPRPWILDNSFSIVEGARVTAGGYSFPSGHSQNAVGTYGAIALVTSKKWIRSLCVAAAILIPFSRMYLGVHTPLDVGTAAVIALCLLVLLKPAVYRDGNFKTFMVILAAAAVIAAGFAMFAECYPFPKNIDPGNRASGIKNAYTLLGAILGFLAVFYVDSHYLHFKTNAVWWAQIIKVVLGLLLVLLVKGGLKYPLVALLGNGMGRAVRYFLVVIVAGLLWPLTFKWFSKLGNHSGGTDSEVIL